MKQTKLQKAVISLGLNDKDSKRQELETSAAGILSGLLCSRFAGATVTACAGIYTHDNGQQVRENSLSVVLYFVTLEQVRDFAGELCRVFNQESVTIETVRRGFFGDRLSVEFFQPGK
jgi:hypothetical protein